jgi:hypothetical protein
VTGARCPRCGLAVVAGALAMCPRCLLADDEEIPEVPPGLELAEEIGRGGMGRVFRARHVGLDRAVAVKLLPAALAGDLDFQARFSREARALAQLDHPHVVGVHDFGVTPGGQSYLVMELMPGGTLAARLPMTAAEAVRVVAEICDGLACAHQRGIVHRDVKPANVLFDAAGHARLADFGIARLLDAPGGGLTRPSLVLGTPAYMAPESRAGAPPDPRADVFAVGVLLHEAVTGRLPEGPPSGLPAVLASIIQRATASDPGRRPSAAALRDELRALGAHDPGALPPEEVSWQRAVALTLAGATAVALYALLVSVSPRVLGPDDTLPFVVVGAERLADGRLATRARFETFATLAAAGAFALALTGYGLLRRHWRHAGVETATPDRPLAGAGAVMRIALLLDGIFVIRLAVVRTEARVLGTYAPVLGGVLELLMVYLVWMAVLEARRTGRSLRREPVLWLGVALALLPPAVSFIRMVRGLAP